MTKPKWETIDYKTIPKPFTAEGITVKLPPRKVRRKNLFKFPFLWAIVDSKGKLMPPNKWSEGIPAVYMTKQEARHRLDDGERVIKIKITPC